MKDLPEPTRQVMAEFLKASAASAHTREALADELLASVAIKTCLTAGPRC
jgi:hypothetical protein